MLLTPEVVGIAASAIGLLGLLARKARCFARRVKGRFEYGVGFTDRSILPEISDDIKYYRCACRALPIIDKGIDGVRSAPIGLNSWRRALKLSGPSKQE